MRPPPPRDGPSSGRGGAGEDSARGEYARTRGARIRMQWLGLYPLTALLTVGGLLLAGVPAGAEPAGSPLAQVRATPSAAPTTAASPTAPPPQVAPLPPVANDDPRFGAVQAAFAPQAAQNAGVKWERLIFPWNGIQPNGPS